MSVDFVKRFLLALGLSAIGFSTYAQTGTQPATEQDRAGQPTQTDERTGHTEHQESQDEQPAARPAQPADPAVQTESVNTDQTTQRRQELDRDLAAPPDRDALSEREQGDEPGAATAATDRADDEDSSAINDARMEGQIWGIFAVNRVLNPFDLDVDVTNRTATLEGEVSDESARELAEQIARDVQGINEVINRINVDPDVAGAETDRDLRADDTGGEGRRFGQVVSDATTTATIKSKLLFEADVSGMAINVSTENDVVTLEGDVDSEAEKELAERIASETAGVNRVVNRLAVQARAE